MTELFSIENVIFSIGGQGVSLIEAISVVSGLTCVYLATRAKVANFWVGYIYNVLLFILFYNFKNSFFIELFQPINDSASCQIVWGELDSNFISR